MTFGSWIRNIFRSEKENGWWENCCKVPRTMTIDPPLPADYEAWIHRCGWILYVHKPTKTRSWMHPVKLANFEAQGLKGPGEYGPEMWIFEKNVNHEGFYCVDYGYPPYGWIRSCTTPAYSDIKIIDRLGWDGWKKQQFAEATAAATRNEAAKEGETDVGQEAGDDGNDDRDPENLATKFKDPEWKKRYNEVKWRVMKEQGVWVSDDLRARYRDLSDHESTIMA